MDKATEDLIPEIGPVQSPLCSLHLLFSPIQREETQSFSSSILLRSLRGQRPLFHHFFSPATLLFFSSFSPTFLPPLFLPWKTQLSACLCGATPQMKWHPAEKTERHSVALPETEFPWRLQLGATQAAAARQRGASVRLHTWCAFHSSVFIWRWSNEIIVSLCRRINTSKQSLRLALGFRTAEFVQTSPIRPARENGWFIHNMA